MKYTKKYRCFIFVFFFPPRCEFNLWYNKLYTANVSMYNGRISRGLNYLYDHSDVDKKKVYFI